MNLFPMNHSLIFCSLSIVHSSGWIIVYLGNEQSNLLGTYLKPNCCVLLNHLLFASAWVTVNTLRLTVNIMILIKYMWSLSLDGVKWEGHLLSLNFATTRHQPQYNNIERFTCLIASTLMELTWVSATKAKCLLGSKESLRTKILSD